MSVPATSRHPGRKGLSKLAKVFIALGLVLLALIALAMWTLRPKGSDGPIISAAEYTVLEREDVSNSVRVTGTVQPYKVQSISTALPGKVSSVDVAAGDRIEEGELVATIDTQATERELENARIQQEGLVASSASQESAARTQYNNYRKSIDEGTNPEILAAQANLRQAISQRDLAQSDYNAKAAARDMAPAEESSALALEVTAAQAALDLAQAAVKDAETGVQTARDAAATQLATLENALTEATNAANSARTTSEQTLGALQNDLNSARITSPLGGVVMNVGVQPGSQPTAAIATIGDDSKLTITSSVRAADIAKVKEGNEVTFTADTTGSREFTGKVTQVSRIAQTQQTGTESNGALAMMGGSASSGQAPAEFTVQIEVTGDREGLYIGSGVKADIITEQEKGTLGVPTDAVFEEEDGTKSVLVLTNNTGTNATIEKRTVETGLTTDATVSLTGGDIAEGDTVISFPEAYRGMEGQEIAVTQDMGY